MPGTVKRVSGRHRTRVDPVKSSGDSKTANRDSSSKTNPRQPVTKVSSEIQQSTTDLGGSTEVASSSQSNISQDTGAIKDPDAVSSMNSTCNFPQDASQTSYQSCRYIDRFDQEHHVSINGPASTISTTSQSCPSGEGYQRENFAFGWKAFPTRVKENRVCRDFLQGRCPHKSMCLRIHPIQPVTVPSRPAVGCENKLLAAMVTHAGQSADQLVAKPSPAWPPKDQIIVNLPSRQLPRGPVEGENRSSPSAKRWSKDSQAEEGSGERSCGVSSIPTIKAKFNNHSSLDRTSASLSSNHSARAHPSFGDRGNRRGGCDEYDYSDLYWDPDTGYWGYRINEDVWRNDLTSDSNITDSSVCSSPTDTPQSSIAEEPPGTDLQNIRKHPPPKYEAICRNWLRGRCWRGHSCNYVHDDLEYDPPVKGKHLRPVNGEVCVRWLQDRCNLGFACNYVHGDLEYDVPAPKTLGSSPIAPVIRLHPQNAPPRTAPSSPWSISVHDHAKVKLDAGFQITEVVTGFETPWVYLTNIPPDVSSDDIIHLLRPFGETLEVKFTHRSGSGTSKAKARFSTAVEARQATTALNGSQAFGSKIIACLPVSDSSNIKALFQDTAVRIDWQAPGKVGYGGFSTMEQAHKAIAATQTPFRDNYVRANIHVGLPVVGVVTVRFYGIPTDANAGDMERFAHPDDLVWERPNYTSLPNAISGIKRILEQELELISFDVQPPPYKRAMVCAWAHFPTPADAQEACVRLHGRKPFSTGKTPIYARHVRSLSYSISPAIYEKVGSDILALRLAAWRKNRSTISVITRPAPYPALVKISGEDLKELGHLKAELEKILNGEILRDAGKVAWDDFFACSLGASFFQQVERCHPGVNILTDINRSMVRLLGSSRQRETVRQALLSKIAELRSQQIRTIFLDGGLISSFTGEGLMVLHRQIGAHNVFLDFQNRRLRIRGNDEVFGIAEQAVQQARERDRLRFSRRVNIAECPVCFDSVTNPVKLSCGHSWCRSCLSNYLMSSIDNKSFPLTCLGNDAKCSQSIPLNVAQSILPVQDFDAIVKAAFAAYIQARPDEFHYCPSPDCPQVYRSAPQEAVLQCPSCLLRICPGCHSEAHDGFACPEADGGDNRFKEWIKNHDVKNCPGCKIPIERAEGCNHLTCTRCQTHICWECLETFPQGQGIYDHMRAVHGGIGLEPIII